MNGKEERGEAHEVASRIADLFTMHEIYYNILLSVPVAPVGLKYRWRKVYGLIRDYILEDPTYLDGWMGIDAMLDRLNSEASVHTKAHCKNVVMYYGLDWRGVDVWGCPVKGIDGMLHHMETIRHIVTILAVSEDPLVIETRFLA